MRGWIGELKVKRRIGKTKKGVRYVINNLRIQINEDITSQIDHVVIQSNGIFVIETKNYSGRIYGKENQLEWTQVLKFGKVKNKFYNPLKQNKTHIYRISQLFENHIPLFSVVVFVQGNTQFIDAPCIYTLSELKKLLNNLSKQLLTIPQMEYIFSTLLQVKKNSKFSTSKHIRNIKKNQKAIKDLICPRCGAFLALRTHNGKSFYGCSNFPKCKFTKKI